MFRSDLGLLAGLLFPLFFLACSEPVETKIVHQPFLAFPPPSVPGLSKKELKKIDLKYFAHIQPGEFFMGSPAGENGRKPDEKQHRVKISKEYFISKFEITVREWNEIVGDLFPRGVQFFVPEENNTLLEWFYSNRKQKPLKGFISDKVTNLNSLSSFFSKFEQFKKRGVQKLILDTKELSSVLEVLAKVNPGNIAIGRLTRQEIDYKLKTLKELWTNHNNLPVTDISYTQALQYCYKKTSHAREFGTLPSKLIFRLPTEAEWEYACRAGNRGVSGFEEGDRLSGLMANINGGTPGSNIGKASALINRKKLTPALPNNPKFAPNVWGIYDTHGNVKEWCYDFYGEYPKGETLLDPIGPIRGVKRVIRGGSFLRAAQSARSACRESLEPSWRGSEIGFRIVLGYPLR